MYEPWEHFREVFINSDKWNEDKEAIEEFLEHSPYCSLCATKIGAWQVGWSYDELEVEKPVIEFYDFWMLDDNNLRACVSCYNEQNPPANCDIYSCENCRCELNEEEMLTTDDNEVLCLDCYTNKLFAQEDNEKAKLSGGPATKPRRKIRER